MADEITTGEMIMQPEEQTKPDLGPDSIPDNGIYKTLVDYCMGLYETFEKSEYRKEKIEEIKESHRVYKQKENPKTKDFPWKDAINITMPLTTITIDNLEPRIVSGLAGTKPIVRFEMKGVEDKDEPTKVIESWFNQELENKVKVETRTMSVVHTILLEGTGYFMPKYDRDELLHRDFVFNQQGQIAINSEYQVDPQGNPVLNEMGMPIPNPEAGKPATKEVTSTLYEGGKIEYIPFTDILCADDIGTVEEWEKADKIRIVRPTYGELMRRKNQIGFMPDKIGPWLLAEKQEGEKTAESQSPGQNVSGVKYTGKEVIECIECYVTYQINKDEEAEEAEQEDFTEERLLATIHTKTKTIIRLCLLRDLNFCNESIIKRVRMFAEEGQSYGLSMYEKLKAIQMGSSDFFNMLLNTCYLVALPWFFYDDTSGLRGKVEIIPGEGIKVDNVKGILIPNFNINPSAYLSFIETFLGLWERLGSIANPQIGRPDDAKKTATEIMMVVQEGNIKFDYQAKTTKEEFISILKTLYDLYYQHMPYNETVNYNKQVVPLPRQLMKRDYKFLLTGSTATANKMIERKEAEDILTISMNNPLMNPVTPLEDVLKSRGKVDLGRYINPQARMLIEELIQNPELPQVVQTYLQKKLETAAELGAIQGENGGGTPNAGNIQRSAVPGVPG